MGLSKQLAARIESLALRENQTPEDFLKSLLDAYETNDSSSEMIAVDGFVGMFDDDVTDMSKTVRETLKRRFESNDDGTD